jgi:hypothetical protein
MESPLRNANQTAFRQGTSISWSESRKAPDDVCLYPGPRYNARPETIGAPQIHGNPAIQ